MDFRAVDRAARQFIDGIWSVFETIGITDLPDLLDGRNTIAVIRALTKLDEPTRNVIIDTLSNASRRKAAEK